MSTTNSTAKGQITFVEVKVMPNQKTGLPEAHAHIVPAGADDEIKAVKSHFNGVSSRHGNFLTEHMLKTRIEMLKDNSDFKDTVGELEKAVKAVQNKNALLKNPLGARVGKSGPIAQSAP